LRKVVSFCRFSTGNVCEVTLANKEIVINLDEAKLE